MDPLDELKSEVEPFRRTLLKREQARIICENERHLEAVKTHEEQMERIKKYSQLELLSILAAEYR